MSIKIQQSTGLIIHLMQKLHIQFDERETIKYLFMESLWHAIEQHETTHQHIKLAQLFELRARNDYREYCRHNHLVRPPARQSRSKQWREENLTKIHWIDAEPDYMDNRPDHSPSPEKLAMHQEALDSLSNDEKTFLELQLHDVRGEKQLADKIGLSHRDFRYMKQGLKKRFLK